MMSAIQKETKICLYGCGEIGLQASMWLKRRKYSKIIYVDSSSEKWGTFLGNDKSCPIENPMILEKGSVDVIIISAKNFHEIFNGLIRYNTEADVFVFSESLKTVISIKEAYRINSWSQDGEDTWLQEKFQKRSTGFFVDVGAHHPLRLSNTLWAYEKGWNGINIEPNYDLFCLFEKYRPRDININIGIANTDSFLKYYCYDEPGLNGFDKECHQKERILEERVVRVRPLKCVLEEYGIKKVDFLNIDVEGLELEVLKSIDFRVSIDCIMVEQLIPLEELFESPVYNFLKEQKYHVLAKYGRTAVYVKEGVNYNPFEPA